MTLTKELHRRIQELAGLAIGERADRDLLVPVLAQSLRVEVSDFLRYHPVQYAASRLRDHEILLASPVARRTTRKRALESGRSVRG